MRLAERVSHLGTETAFAVSAEAAAHAARGRKIYPFHLGDINLPTPENIVAATLAAIRRGRTGYCPNAGIPELREALAREINRTHGTRYGPGNVAVQPGGKPVIGKFIQATMDPGDEVLCPSPGYPIYESLIGYFGGRAVPYGYREGADGFEIDLESLERAVTPRTRLLIVNSPQNPLAADASPGELSRLADLARRHDLLVLCDEAYFDTRYEGVSRSLVSEPGMEERCLILYTFSKRFAMTGWRLGAAIGPAVLIEAIARLNVNDESCSTHFIQYGALEALTGDQAGPRRILGILRERRDVACELLNGIRGVRCHRPKAAFYLYPDVTEVVRRKGWDGYPELRERTLEATGVSFCTRLHFGRPLPGETGFHIRLAYAGIDTGMIEEGLARLKCFLES